jgi:fructose-bisphosphate aldolase class II
MPVATPDQYRSMIDTARSAGFAYPAVNVSSSETLNAALRGFAEARSDGIVQITTSAARYLSGSADDMAAGARAFAEFAHIVAARSPVLIALHTDHATPEHVDDFIRPLLRETRRRRERGELPLFNSHMFDGSELPLAENLRISGELLREANELDVLLELEIGTVGGEEDGIDHTGAARERLYTTPEDARAVAKTLGMGDAAATCSQRPSATSTATTRPATCTYVPNCSPSSRQPSPTHAASTSSSTAAAAPPATRSKRRSRTAS